MSAVSALPLVEMANLTFSFISRFRLEAYRNDGGVGIFRSDEVGRFPIKDLGNDEGVGIFRNDGTCLTFRHSRMFLAGVLFISRFRLEARRNEVTVRINDVNADKEINMMWIYTRYHSKYGFYNFVIPACFKRESNVSSRSQLKAYWDDGIKKQHLHVSWI